MVVSKYNANGNDFVIFHTFKNADRSDLARILCNRTKGVGADGLIVLLPNGANSVKWEFYNNDGSYAAMCGNGSRAAFLYAYKNKLISADATLLTGAGEIIGSVRGDVVEVELTSPKILSAEPINDSDKTWYLYDTGVPHLVSFVSDLAEFDVSLARKMRQKYNANVNFALIDNNGLRVRTYERGVENETLACGTGMAACFYGGVLNYGLKNSVKVYPKSGEELGLRLEGGKIFFSGAVAHTFDADFKIHKLAKQK